MNKTRGRGRPQGPSSTREQILTAARARFLTDGYQRVTMRQIAADAGVDAALISYFFGSKRGLFGATLSLAANPLEVFATALPGDPRTLPERLVRALLTAWDDQTSGQDMRAMIEAALREPDTARLLREVIEREMITRLAEHLGGPDASYRAAVVGTQLSGLVFSRYILALEPVASMPADELIALLAPAIRTVLAPGPRPPYRRPRPQQRS
ncbi:MAG: TetR family transcriptional regulator [Mycobacteriales bacterium]